MAMTDMPLSCTELVWKAPLIGSRRHVEDTGKRGESEDSLLRDEIEVVITAGAGEDD
jgi:hypothetical protein